MDYKKIQNQTKDKFESGEFMVGDIFSEMLSHWKVIIKVEGDQLTLITGSSKNLKMSIVNKDEFTKSCRYGHIDGYWIDFMKNDTKRCGDFVEAYIEQQKMDPKQSRDFKLDLVLV